MNLPPEILKQISDGCANFRTWSMIGSFRAIMPVPKNKEIIITKINYQGFLPINDPLDRRDWNILRDNILHYLKVYSGKSTNGWFIREEIREVRDQSIAGNTTNSVVTNIDIDCYLVHNEDVKFEITQATEVGSFVLNTSLNIPKAGSGVKRPPLGQEGIDNVNQLSHSTQLYGLAAISSKYEPLDATLLTGQYNAAEIPASTATRPPLPDPTEDYFPWTMPIINVQYVELNRRLTSTVQGT